MDLEGYKRLESLFEGGVEIKPVPKEGEDVRFVDITSTSAGLGAVDILNVLSFQGLMERNGPRDAVFTTDPSFKLVAATMDQEAVLLEDTSSR